MPTISDVLYPTDIRVNGTVQNFTGYRQVDFLLVAIFDVPRFVREHMFMQALPGNLPTFGEPMQGDGKGRHLGAHNCS